MKNKTFLFIFISLLFSYPSVGQYLIQGIVLDSKTDEPIPFASVGIQKIHRGTSTNLNGEFLLKIDSLPVTIMVSHIGYKRQELDITDEVPLRIRLKPSEIIMPEMVISGKPQTDYAYSLLANAYDHVTALSNKSSYGKAFYRQISQNDDDYSELYEIFYDTRYSAAGILEWAIQEGRYAMNTGPNTSDYVYNKNYTLISRLFTTFQPETDKFIMPVSHEARQYFDVKTRGTRNIDGHKAMIIQFAPKENIRMPAMEGEILIDEETYDIYMITAKIRHDNFDVISLTNPVGSWKNYEISFTIAYKRDADKLLLDFIKVDQLFDYLVDGQFKHKAATHSFLTYYEYYTPEKFKNLGGRIVRFNRSDRELLNKVGYNRQFWDENPIVKRTPLENNVIASFEASKSFGSIYLNDKEQVQLESTDIDKDPFINEVSIAIRNTRLASRGEKVYLHFDKPFYAAGETMWFSAYLVNESTNIPYNYFTTLYFDVIDPGGKIVSNRIIRIDDNVHEGSFDIPGNYPSGVYRIRAYTNWMKNKSSEFFFDKTIPIYNPGEVQTGNNVKVDQYADYDVQFFPEGGYLLNEIPGMVAFKAMDVRGSGINITGKVLDDLGKQVAEFQTRHDGMGSFFIMPDSGRKYTVNVKYLGDEKKYELPRALEQGITATVNPLKKNVIQVIVKGTSEFNNREVYIVGQSGGIIYHKEKEKMVKGSAMVTIPKGKLPPGIFHITIFDDKKIPRIERLVFKKPDNELFIDMKAGKENPGYRDTEEVKVKIMDQYGNPVSGAHLSVAVTDAGKIKMPEYAEDIQTRLLLQSDLPGTINDPGYYFKDDERETLLHLDLIMLTNGWRRFKWENIINEKKDDIRYLQEGGVNISGTVHKSNSKEPLKNGYINFISLNNNYMGYMMASTNQAGRFELSSLDIPDTLRVLTQSFDTDGKPADVEIILDNPEIIKTEIRPVQNFPADVSPGILRYLQNERQYSLLNSGSDKERRIMLKEVIVKTERFDRSFYGEPDDTYTPGIEAGGYSDILQMIQGRFAGVSVTGHDMQAKVIIRGVASVVSDPSPLFLVDGMAINPNKSTDQNGPGSNSLSQQQISSTAVIINATQNDANSNQNPRSGQTNEINSLLFSISPDNVERIEILKNPGTTAVFGIQGANGVIAIFTKKGMGYNKSEIKKGYSEVRFKGFSLVKEFYSPSYVNKNADDKMPDIRSLLYWNPVLITNRKGEVEFKYSNSDSAKRHQVVVEGISDYGDIIQFKKEIGKEDQ